MITPDKSSGPCFVCGTDIHLLQFECGHVISHIDSGLLTVENLRPICGSCNKSMGTQNLWDYKIKFFSPSQSQHTPIIVSPPKPHLKTIEKSLDNPITDSIDKLTLGVLKLTISSLPSVPTLRLKRSPFLDGCQHILIKGKRKGQKCGKNLHENEYCRPHSFSHHST